jgi:hypothetical protein
VLDPAALAGAWALVGSAVDGPDGGGQLFGGGADGLLIYTPDGWMSATLSARGRPRLGQGLERAHRAGVDARAAAFDGAMHYAGRWWTEGDEVVHEVRHALLPDLVGQTLRRRAQLEPGPRLRLSYSLPARGGARAFTLDWAPLPAAPGRP